MGKPWAYLSGSTTAGSRSAARSTGTDPAPALRSTSTPLSSLRRRRECYSAAPPQKATLKRDNERRAWLLVSEQQRAPREGLHV